MKPKIILLTILLAGIFFITTESCHRKNAPKTVVLDAKCLLKHEAGPCRGAFKRYYYDKREKKCKSFIYGGCQGVVPFETMEECEGKCNCK